MVLIDVYPNVPLGISKHLNRGQQEGTFAASWLHNGFWINARPVQCSDRRLSEWQGCLEITKFPLLFRFYRHLSATLFDEYRPPSPLLGLRGHTEVATEVHWISSSSLGSEGS